MDGKCSVATLLSRLEQKRQGRCRRLFQVTVMLQPDDGSFKRQTVDICPPNLENGVCHSPHP